MPESQDSALPLRFNCLNNRTVVEAQVSDHNPVILRSALGYTFCTFNILMQCANGNNGFKRVETLEEYQSRLSGPITDLLLELANRYQVDFFLLQEAPPPDVGKAFYNQLRSRMSWITINETLMYLPVIQWQLEGISLSGGVFTMYPKQFMAKDVTNDPYIIDKICPANRRRFQAFFFNIPGGEGFKVANFHGDFKDQVGMTSDIRCLLEENTVIGGDFNLKALPDFGVPEADTTTVPGMFPYNTYDAIFDGPAKRHLHRLIACLRNFLPF